MKNRWSLLLRSPYRFLIAAAALAAFMCMFPVYVDAPVQSAVYHGEEAGKPQAGLAAGADLTVRTQSHAYLHRTTTYLPCGHSVQRRETLPAALAGLSRAALEQEMGDVLPGARITGFSAQEVDVAIGLDMPCPLHWVLIAGENGRLQVQRNLTGEKLETVRQTDIEQALLDETTRGDLLEGLVFDDVQALEGYLESLSS
ncbi:MAG: hypothetical protein IKB82_07395 [Clostridia bacterium]|nr:hypothetical protein [Clostridia bacterium]